MTDTISITAAELSYLLSVADPDGTSIAPPLLSLTPDEHADAVRAAGLGSLALRGHLETDGATVALTPALTAVARGLGQPEVVVGLGLVAPDATDGAVFVETGPVRLVAAPRAFRCFDITGLTIEGDLVDHVTDVAKAFLADRRPGVAAMNVYQAGQAADPAQARIAVDAADVWTVAQGSDVDNAETQPNEQAAWDAFSAILAG